MDVNQDVAGWILEYLLLQSQDYSTTKALIRLFPGANHNTVVEKTLLLREIESEISKGEVSEKILGLVEIFEEIEFQQGIEASEDLKAAYSAVAVDCTVRFLKEDGGGAYFDAIERIWSKRIGKIEKMDKVGLVSEEMWKWRDEFKRAVLEDRCDHVKRKSQEIDAVGTVQHFVKKAMQKMEPPFLERLAHILKRDHKLREPLEQVADSNDSTHHHQDVHEGSPSKPQSPPPQIRKFSPWKIPDYGLPTSPEVAKVLNDLETSMMELRAVVKDPLPEALRIANGVIEEMLGRKPSVPAPSVPAPSVPAPSVPAPSVPAPSVPAPSVPAPSVSAPSVPAPSVPEAEGPSSPKVSPEHKKQRRKNKKWSSMEEDTLRMGVDRYGKGSWKYIKNAYPDVFGERTEVDLKDKWRNMIAPRRKAKARE